MKLLNRPASLLAVALAGLALSASPAHAVVLAENTATGFSSFNSVQFVGQSFTVTGSGSFTNISFNFFQSTSLTPHAVGTAFLLSSPYAGAPGALSSGTTGFLGSAAASGGFYNFGSGVTLVAGTQYFLYANGAIGAFIAANNGVYAGGAAYATTPSDSSSFLAQGSLDSLFRVTGDAATANAPDGGSTALLLALGLAGLGLARRNPRA